VACSYDASTGTREVLVSRTTSLEPGTRVELIGVKSATKLKVSVSVSLAEDRTR